METTNNKKEDADAKLNTQEFYELMQAYRHAPMTDQAKLVERFESVKDWIRKNYV